MRKHRLLEHSDIYHRMTWVLITMKRRGKGGKKRREKDNKRREKREESNI